MVTIVSLSLFNLLNLNVYVHINQNNAHTGVTGLTDVTSSAGTVSCDYVIASYIIQTKKYLV